jgi:tetratricopeptide (TPR) repeat protein
VLLGIAAYANGLSAPFVFDDRPAIAENAHIRQVWPLSTSMSAPAQSPLSGRPIVSLSFALNHALAGSVSPAAFRLGNLAIHIAAALLLFAIARRTLSEPASFCVAAIWLVHPLQSEAVDYVTQRTESLMGLLYLATLYAAIRGWTAVAIAACGLGMAAKESMVTAPVMVLAYDAIFQAGSWRTALRRRPVLYAGLAATWIVLAALNVSGPRSYTAGFATPVSVWSYALNQPAMIGTYIERAFWPAPLILDYGPARDVTLRSALPWAIVIALLIALTFAAARRAPALAFLGTWFFATLAPASSVIPIATEAGAERRMYLPLAAIVVLAVVVARALGARLRASTRTVGAAGFAVVAALALVTIQRNDEYRHPVELWRRVVEHRPSGRARHAFGFALQQAGRRDEAIQQYRLAAPEYSLAHYNLALQLIAMERLDDAAAELGHRLRREPADVDARGTLADLLLRQRRFGDAEREYDALIRLAPDNAAAHNNLGMALVKQNRVDAAIQELRIAVALAPRDPGPRENLARTEALASHPRPSTAMR